MTETDEQRIARLRAELDDLERRYAQAELKGAGRTAATARRGPVSLIAVLLGVALAVGVVAAVDLRRLQTPTGAALGWAGAAVFGDCTAYRELSVPEDGAGAGDPDAQCRELRTATEGNRDRAGEVELEVVAVAEDGDDAVATLRLVQPGQRQVRLDLPLRRDGDGWAVVRTAAVCAVVGCP